MGSGSPLQSRFSAAAVSGKLMLPVCKECSAVQYPLRDYCRQCLSSDVEFQDLDGAGVVLATTRLHRSADERFAPLLPLRIGFVQLAVGPTVLSFLPDKATLVDEQVQVSAELDQWDNPVLRVRSTEHGA